MLNRPDHQADGLTQDNDEINGAEPITPNRPVWERRPRSIAAAIAAALLLGGALIPMGPGAFAIEAGKGFIPTLNYDQSINLSEHCGTPLFMGKRQTFEHRITYEVARLLKAETDRVQVTVGVREGERFNYRRNLFGIGVWANDACPASEPQYF